MNFDFGISITVEEKTGEVLAGYFRVRRGKIAHTREYAEGAVFADYHANGTLLGIELLGPCKFTILDKIAKDEVARKFLRRSAPPELVSA